MVDLESQGNAVGAAEMADDRSAAELRFLRAQLADEAAARQAAEAQARRADGDLQKLKAELLAAKDQHAAAVREHEAALAARFKENATLMSALKRAQDREMRVQELVAQADKVHLLVTRLLGALLRQAAPKYLPANVRLQRKCALLDEHSLFDATWYLNQNPDVSEAGVNPAEHFVTHGLREGRSVNRTMEDLRRCAAALQEKPR